MSYWKVRQQEQLKALEKDEKELMNRLLNYYQAEYAKLDKEIASFYKRYGEKNIIEYRNLLLELPQQEKKLLIEQVEKFAKQYPHLKHIVPVRENIYKLNRLEGLQLSIVMQQFEIGAYNEENVRKHLEKLALRNVNSVADLLGFGKNFYFENKEIIKNFVGVKWCEGKDFSMRIWQNTEKLANYLTTDIAQGFARGESYENLTTLLGKRFINVTKKDVYRVIYTEGTYVMAESSAKTLEQEFGQYKLSTVSDGKECSKCREIAGKTFNFAEREPGVNFPPIHPMCRCTFEIIVDDWNKWLDEYEKKQNDRVYSIGKIDKNIYSCVTDSILTNDVIITGNRISHIKQRHPDDYERFNKYFNEIVSNPDYIIEANRVNTALILKEIKSKKEMFKTVLRIVTSVDDSNYKNSIITFMKIDEKEWDRLLRNKKILYKRE